MKIIMNGTQLNVLVKLLLLFAVLAKWMCVFVFETRSKSGKEYSPKSITSLLSGIIRHKRLVNPDYPNFMNTDDPCFASFNVTLSNLYKSLRSEGVGTESRPTEPITTSEEEQLWVSGVLNIKTPKSLLRCVFFYVGKTFCL